MKLCSLNCHYLLWNRCHYLHHDYYLFHHCYQHAIIVPVIVIIIPSLLLSCYHCYHHAIIVIIIPSLLSSYHHHSPSLSSYHRCYHYTIIVITIPSLLSPWSYYMKNTVIPLLLLRPQSRCLLIGLLVFLCPVSSSINQDKGFLVYEFQIFAILKSHRIWHAQRLLCAILKGP